MFFKLHKENKIGYKKLSKADLGLNSTSHQTHIGLFNDVLTFLPNSIEVDDAMLIFNGHVEYLPVAFDRIENKDHTFRSPKIRQGELGAITITSQIRSIVKKNDPNDDWYLIWFGLESEQLVFFIFNKNSNAYLDISKIGLTFSNEQKQSGRLTSSSNIFKPLVSYLERIINQCNDSLLDKIEDAIQANSSEDTLKQEKIRTYDFDKAKQIFEKIGLAGEKKVNIFLKTQKEKGLISNYHWYNETKENYGPYDFHIEDLRGNCIYLDVKSTPRDFSQKMYFSSQEIEFACSHTASYCIYRVYLDENGVFYLKICKDTSNLFPSIEKAISSFLVTLNNCADVETIKFSISPISLLFDQPIKLDF